MTRAERLAGELGMSLAELEEAGIIDDGEEAAVPAKRSGCGIFLRDGEDDWVQGFSQRDDGRFIVFTTPDPADAMRLTASEAEVLLRDNPTLKKVGK